MTESITPSSKQSPQIRYQPSMLSVPSSAATVAPEQQAPEGAAKPRAGARRKLWFFATLAAMAGVVAAGALASPTQPSPHVQSGSPGFRTSKSGQPMHWQSKALTVYLDESLNKIGPGAKEAVMQAFGGWVESDARLPDLSFDTGKTSALPTLDGKSTISYGRITAPGHERNLAITVTYARDKDGEILEADIVLNSLYPIGVLTPNGTGAGDKDRDGHGKPQQGDDKTASASEVDTCQNRYDVQNVTTHEAGHFFGLGEDPVERDAAMFQTIDQCETHKRSLATTDTSALSTLYADVEDPEEAAAGPRACSFVAAPGGSNWGWISALVVGLALTRRRR